MSGSGQAHESSSLSWISDALQAAASAPGQVWQAVREQPVTELAAEGVRSISDKVGGLVAQVTGGNLVQRLEDRYDRTQAALRWSKRLGPSQRLPMTRQLDDKAMLASISLAKVVHDQVSEHGSLDIFLHRPTTMALVGGCVALFFSNGVEMRDVCLSPYCVVERGQWDRLFTCALVHLDTGHLLSNLASCVPEALDLEASSGPLGAAAELVALTAAAHGTYVLWAWGQKRMFSSKREYYSVGALGLSSLAFSLQVVGGERRSAYEGRMIMLGPVRIPARFTWLLGLLLSHVCSPEASFSGHLCGVAAGLTYVYGLEPLLHALKLRRSPRWELPSSAAQPRFYGAGTTGGRIITTGSGTWQRRAAWWKHWAKQLGGQLAAVALAAAVYVATSRRRSPINTWDVYR